LSKPNLSVLIVDDEPRIRHLMSRILISLGYSVRCAEDGYTALARIKEACPDVLLSDLNMPGMSGFELLSEVRQRFPGIYVIATSGSFSGTLVPQGVVADVFYEKATSLSLLLQHMERGARWKQEPSRSSGMPTPWWIAPTRIEACETEEFAVSLQAI
jgi:CheY-like chemotaxis protein